MVSFHVNGGTDSAWPYKVFSVTNSVESTMQATRLTMLRLCSRIDSLTML